MSTILPLLSTSLIAISAILVAFGWRHIIKGRREQHQRTMITAAVFALLFFIIYVSRTFIVGNTAFGGPDEIKIYYQIFLLFHILLAIVAAVFGIVTLTLAFKKNFRKHRKIGPYTSIIWFATAITGVTVYLLLYVIFPKGETTDVISKIFNF